MAIKLGREEIMDCFDALNQKLAEHSQHGEILVCGGASMALLFDDTTVTKDIDAVILSTEMKNDISRYTAEIGEERGLDEDWFNEAAKGYINLTWKREEISKYSNLAVYSVPAEQLLAMKLSAARTDGRDLEDSVKLMEHLGLQEVDEALGILERNMPERILTIRNEFFAREAFAAYQEKELATEKRRLFVDMDGTLAVFTPVDTMETLYEKGYYADLEPHENVVQGIRQFIEQEPNAEIYVLSAVLEESAYALEEKNAWLNWYLPEIDQEHRIFLPCGKDKAMYVPSGIKPEDVLLDDYSENLHQWQAAGGIGIKMMNGINGTRGSWMGQRIEYDITPEQFCHDLIQYLQLEKESEELITIGGQECVKVEEWQIENDHYVLGRAIQQQEDEDFHYAIVNDDLNNIFEYDERPPRQKVEDNYIDRESMRDLDRHEAEFGADGYRMFPSLQKEKEALAVKQDFAGMPAELMEAYERLYQIPEDKRYITDGQMLKDGVTRTEAAAAYGKALQAIGYSAEEMEYVYPEEYYNGDSGDVRQMMRDMMNHQMAEGKPIAYIAPDTNLNAFIATMDEESRQSIEMAIRLAEIQEGYVGTELEEKVTEAMSNRLSAIDESLHIEKRMDLSGPDTMIIENGGNTYAVLATADSKHGNADLLLMRTSDRHFLIAKGWDEKSQTWDHGQYFGWGADALAKAASEFVGHDYVRSSFAQSSLQEQFRTILEAEFPETSGEETLQDSLYEMFMESSQVGLFGNDLMQEMAKEIVSYKQNECELEANREAEYE